MIADEVAITVPNEQRAGRRPRTDEQGLRAGPRRRGRDRPRGLRPAAGEPVTDHADADADPPPLPDDLPGEDETAPALARRRRPTAVGDSRPRWPPTARRDAGAPARPLVGVLAEVKVLVIGSGAREHALVRALVARPGRHRGRRRPGQRRHRGRGACQPARRDRPGCRRRPGRRGSAPTWSSSARRRRWWPEPPTRSGPRDRLLRAVRRRRPARGVEGVRQGRHGRGGRADRRGRSSADAAEAAARARRARRAVRREGRRPRGRQGRRGERATATPPGRTRPRASGSSSRSTSTAPRCRCSRSPTARTVVPLLPAQDFKRVGDGDTGPNTGGMGAYTPAAVGAGRPRRRGHSRPVLQPTVDEMARRGTPFAGLLYAGLALTSRGVRVIEFNARFGDPETQVVLARLRTPARVSCCGPPRPAGSPRWAAVVVGGRRGHRRAGGGGLPGARRALAAPSRGSTWRPRCPARILHAGTALDAHGNVVSSGGRVLSWSAPARRTRRARGGVRRDRRGPARRQSLPDGHRMPVIPDVLATRYASAELVAHLVAEHKVVLERRLWIAVLTAQRDLGVDVPGRRDRGLREGRRPGRPRLDRQPREGDPPRREGADRGVRGARRARARPQGDDQPRPHRERRAAAGAAESLALLRDRAVAALARLAALATEHADLVIAGRSHNVAAQATTLGQAVRVGGRGAARRGASGSRS